MIKTIIKEAFLMILIGVAIALILAVVFYDYVPVNKVIPDTIQYSMPSQLSEIKEELDNTIENRENEKATVTYEITEEDLSGYKQTNTYNAGKANPFAEYSNETQQNINNNNEHVSTKDNDEDDGKEAAPTQAKASSSSSSGVLFENKNTK